MIDFHIICFKKFKIELHKNNTILFFIFKNNSGSSWTWTPDSYISVSMGGTEIRKIYPY